MSKPIQIFLEGNEGCFKTTIAEKLSQRTGFEIIQGSSFEIASKTNEEMLSYFLDTLLKKENVIVDRFIWSNLVYATLYPKFTILTGSQSSMISELIRSEKEKHRHVVYLYADNETLKNRIRIRGDEHISEHELLKINNQYMKVWAKSMVFPSYYNTVELNSDEIVDRIIEFYIEPRMTC